jgi:hypothetical protein
MTARTGPRVELRLLKSFIAQIERRFLTPHLNATSFGVPGTEEQLDTAAYAVLAHGAMENFVEGIALWVIRRLEQSWLSRSRATSSTAAVLLYEAAPDLDKDDATTVYNGLRAAIATAKSTVSMRVKDNNGIAPAHLRRLLRPVGVDIPDDPVLLSSLNQLVLIRHQWAHQYRYGAKVVKSASDIRTVVSDCVAIAEKVADRANRLRP